jgi:hypothetical protein
MFKIKEWNPNTLYAPEHCLIDGGKDFGDCFRWVKLDPKYSVLSMKKVCEIFRIKKYFAILHNRRGQEVYPWGGIGGLLDMGNFFVNRKTYTKMFDIYDITGYRGRNQDAICFNYHWLLGNNCIQVVSNAGYYHRLHADSVSMRLPCTAEFWENAFLRHDYSEKVIPVDFTKNNKEYIWLNSYSHTLQLYKHNKCKIGVEIGTSAGNHLEYLLKNTDIELVVGIDSYNKECWNTAEIPSNCYDEFYRMVKSRMYSFRDRCWILRKTSEQAIEFFPDESLDFVFIDAGHTYEDVKKDIELWIPKVKNGGIISGHNWHHPKFPGVTQAVNELLSTKYNIK